MTKLVDSSDAEDIMFGTNLSPVSQALRPLSN